MIYRRPTRARLLSFSLSLALVACGGSSSSSPSDAGTDDSAAHLDAAAVGTPPAAPASCPVVVKAADCDTSQRPILFVHGTYSSGTDIAHMAALLGSNGFCQDRIAAIDYDSVSASAGFTGGGVDSPGVDCTGPNTPSGCGMIDKAITALLQKFPQFTQVDLAGHSQGTFHCGNYLANHADRVAHYINFSGVPAVGDVQTLSLSSDRDLFGSPHHATGTSVCAYHQTEDGGTEAMLPAGGAADASASGDGGAGCNVVQYTFIHQDHFAVAASKDSFVQVYKYLTGKDPMYTDIQCGDDPVTVEGVAETFADNVPIAGQARDPRGGPTPRDTTAPTMTLTSDSSGHFGPVMLKRNVEYVFIGYDASGKIVGWQYFTPFKRDNRLIRLLSPASASDGSPRRLHRRRAEHRPRRDQPDDVARHRALGPGRHPAGPRCEPDGQRHRGALEREFGPERRDEHEPPGRRRGPLPRGRQQERQDRPRSRLQHELHRVHRRVHRRLLARLREPDLHGRLRGSGRR